MATTTNSEEKPLAPIVKWAQRHDVLYVTIALDDIKDEKIELKEKSLFFHAKGGPEGKTYEVQLNFLHEVDPVKSKQHKSGREMQFKVQKKELGPYWSRLLVEKKVHYLKVDFNRWKDEDDSEPEDGAGQMDDRNLEDIMQQMSSGTQNIPDMDDLQGPDSDDSDDEDLPDLEDTGETKE